jgi:hypothetical protein
VPAGPEAASGILAIYQDELLGRPAGGAGAAAAGGLSGSTAGARADDDVAWSRTWEGLRNASRACVDVLDPIWLSRTPAEGFGDRAEPRRVGEAAEVDRDRPAGRVGPDEAADGDEVLSEWVRAAEDLVALEVIALVSQSTVQLKGLTYYLAAAPVLLLMAVSSYPFQPQRFLQVCLWGILMIVAVGVIWVYVRMEKDEFISRVSRTDPNRISMDRTFLGNLLAFFIPLIGVALAQFPFMSDTLNQWFEPITRVLK